MSMATFSTRASSSGEYWLQNALRLSSFRSSITSRTRASLNAFTTVMYSCPRVMEVSSTTTLAGSGEPGYADGKGVAAAFDVIGGIAADQDGTLYVSDTFNHLVRKVTPDGTVSTLAGQAKQTGSVNGALAPARFFGPAGVAIGAGGSLFVADTFNHTVRRIE